MSSSSVKASGLAPGVRCSGPKSLISRAEVQTDKGLSVPEVASLACLSQSRFAHFVVKETGHSFRNRVHSPRMMRALQARWRRSEPDRRRPYVGAPGLGPILPQLTTGVRAQAASLAMVRQGRGAREHALGRSGRVGTRASGPWLVPLPMVRAAPRLGAAFAPGTSLGSGSLTSAPTGQTYSAGSDESDGTRRKCRAECGFATLPSFARGTSTPLPPP